LFGAGSTVASGAFICQSEYSLWPLAELVFHVTKECVKFCILDRHGMRGSGVSASVDIGLILSEGGNALCLQLFQHWRHIAVNLAMAWLMIFAIAANILGKEILRVCVFTRAHSEHNQRRVFAKIFADAVWHDLELSTKDTDFFHLLRVPRAE